MDRQDQFIAMLNEDNEMLVEDNEILRNKLTTLSNFIDKKFTEVTIDLANLTNIHIDYFIGQRSILTEIKKLL